MMHCLASFDLSRDKHRGFSHFNLGPLSSNLPRAFLMAGQLFPTQSKRACVGASRLFPSPVNSYSTRGGTSGSVADGAPLFFLPPRAASEGSLQNPLQKQACTSAIVPGILWCSPGSPFGSRCSSHG